MSSFFRETARLTARYAVVAAAAIPAGIMYGVARPTSMVVIVVLVGGSALLGEVAWRATASWMKLAQPVPISTANIGHFSSTFGVSPTFALATTLIWATTPAPVTHGELRLLGSSQIAPSTAVQYIRIQ